ncbi:hypothetical protein J1605_021968 [Eschrichtius robustus]|uniref:Armadillo-like helical domain-containing protein n=1 Tax=Eschrichtius robustus TaxID=9764 RepID=A0AB34HEJ9_ESCRO|nr:hypothetical protein J1605_021968 [Eschrichtius robustus]
MWHLPRPGLQPVSPALADEETGSPSSILLLVCGRARVLEVVRANYDTLTLKLQDGLDQYERYSEQHKEAAFFKELVRSISTNVRRNLAFHTLSQEVLLKEFSTIS